MIEILVSMVIMSIVLSIFTAGVLQIYRTINKTESLSTAQSQIKSVFQRLDREVRYASAISDPLTTGTTQYVEYLMAGSGASTCVQLQLNTSTGKLRRRQWTKGASASTGTWAVLVTSVGAGTPKSFVFTAAGATFNYQRLQVNLLITAGSGSNATVRETRVTFTALNSPIDPTDPLVCTDGRAVP